MAGRYTKPIQKRSEVQTGVQKALAHQDVVRIAGFEKDAIMRNIAEVKEEMLAGTQCEYRGEQSALQEAVRTVVHRQLNMKQRHLNAALQFSRECAEQKALKKQRKPPVQENEDEFLSKIDRGAKYKSQTCQTQEKVEKQQSLNEAAAKNLTKVKEQMVAKTRREDQERSERMIAKYISKQQQKEEEKARDAATAKETVAYWGTQVQRRKELCLKAEQKEKLQEQRRMADVPQYKQDQRLEAEQRRQKAILCNQVNNSIKNERRKQAEREHEETDSPDNGGYVEKMIRRKPVTVKEDITVYWEKQKQNNEQLTKAEQIDVQELGLKLMEDERLYKAEERQKAKQKREKTIHCSEVNKNIAKERCEQAERQRREDREAEKKELRIKVELQQKQEIQARNAAITHKQDTAVFWRKQAQSKEQLEKAEQNKSHQLRLKLIEDETVYKKEEQQRAERRRQQTILCRQANTILLRVERQRREEQEEEEREAQRQKRYEMSIEGQVKQALADNRIMLPSQAERESTEKGYKTDDRLYILRGGKRDLVPRMTTHEARRKKHLDQQHEEINQFVMKEAVAKEDVRFQQRRKESAERSRFPPLEDKDDRLYILRGGKRDLVPRMTTHEARRKKHLEQQHQELNQEVISEKDVHYPSGLRSDKDDRLYILRGGKRDLVPRMTNHESRRKKHLDQQHQELNQEVISEKDLHYPSGLRSDKDRNGADSKSEYNEADVGVKFARPVSVPRSRNGCSSTSNPVEKDSQHFKRLRVSPNQTVAEHVPKPPNYSPKKTPLRLSTAPIVLEEPAQSADTIALKNAHEVPQKKVICPPRVPKAAPALKHQPCPPPIAQKKPPSKRLSKYMTNRSILPFAVNTIPTSDLRNTLKITPIKRPPQSKQ